MTIADSIVISAPIDLVFSEFTNLDSVQSNISGIDSIDVLEGSAKMQVGTKWKETRTMFGKEATEIMWVTDIQPNASYVVEAESHGTHYHTLYTFTEVEDGVKVEMVFSGKPLTLGAKFFSLLLFLFAGATKKALKQDMEDIKQAIESK